MRAGRESGFVRAIEAGMERKEKGQGLTPIGVRYIFGGGRRRWRTPGLGRLHLNYGTKAKREHTGFSPDRRAAIAATEFVNCGTTTASAGEHSGAHQADGRDCRQAAARHGCGAAVDPAEGFSGAARSGGCRCDPRFYCRTLSKHGWDV